MNRLAALRAFEAAVCRATVAAPTLAARVDGAPITPMRRDELLERCGRGAYVEIEVDLVAYEQKPGAANRNFVRFRDGSLIAMGRSGVGTPFLRDHAQDSVAARGGTIVASTTEKRGEGDYVIRQTARLTAPWAVEAVLRGLIAGISIGWKATGAVECSLCKASIADCFHWPGERYRLDERGDLERSDEGDLVCELVYTEADLVETSAVNVPAVPSASVVDVRAELAALRAAAVAAAPSSPHQRETSAMPTAARSAPSSFPSVPTPRNADEVLSLAERRGVITRRDSHLAEALRNVARSDPAEAARLVERDLTPIQQVELIIGQVPHASLDVVRRNLRTHANCADPDALLCRVYAERPRPRKPQALAVEARLTKLGFDPMKIRRDLRQAFGRADRDDDAVDHIFETHIAKLLDDHYGPARSVR